MIKLKDIAILKYKSELNVLPQGKLLINTINAYSYNTARNDAFFAEALLKGDVLIPDGASIVKAIKWLRGEQIERIAGWDLFVHEMEKLNATSSVSITAKKVFFLGSSEAVLTKIKNRASKEYPNLEIHTFSPPYKPKFTDDDSKIMIEAVNRVQPNLLWIGMTAPKQEKWVYAHLDMLDAKGTIGTIGAVFDFYAGTVERAPLWWQAHSLEWLFRLIKEPRRMWKRYIIGNTKFLYYVAMELFQKRV
ncbi:MAG: WecB/TagA/CpsF family glycosyltransferase [Paludibacteraceae bacterium]